MSDTILKEGNIVKRSRGRGMSKAINWQLRRLYLNPTKLSYGNVGAAPKDNFPLLPTSTVKQCVMDGKEYCFVVQSGEEEFYLNAANDADRDEWMTAVKEAVAAMNPSAAAAAEAAEAAEGTRSSAPATTSDSISNGAEQASQELSKLSKAQLESQELLLREQKAAQEAKAKREAMLQRMRKPCACQKKLSTESGYHDRFVWINPESMEFHWAKNAEEAANGKSKCLSIQTHIIAAKRGAEADGSGYVSFSLQFADAAALPVTVFGGSGKFFGASTAPAGMDIRLQEADLCDAFVRFIGSKGVSV